MEFQGILAEAIGYNGYNGDRIEGYYARPMGPGPFPGVVLIHHAPAWDMWTREFCRRLAENGYATLSPHLYSRNGAGSPDDVAARARAEGGVHDDQVVGDVVGSMNYLRAQPQSNGRVGAIGFCAGGRQVFLAACRIPELDAIVDCWGGGVIAMDPSQITEKRPVEPITLAEHIRAPILGLFGNEDWSPTAEEVNRTEQVLKNLGKHYEFHRYDGASHAFMTVDRHYYRPEQATDAWTKIFDFYGRFLSTPVPAGAM